jgi:5,10-methylenetetrahydromethanopterin reductase
LDWVELADEKGFDYVWFPHDTFCKSTWVMTCAAVQRTRRMKIGSIGTNPYTFNPCEIATYVATLDELSGGRAVLGLGLHTSDMLAWVGIHSKDVVTGTREAVEMVRGLLRGEVVEYRGEEFRWTDQAYLRFKPVRPHIPIYGCAYGPEYLAMTGEICDGSLPMVTPPEAAGYMVGAIRKGMDRAGRAVEDVDISGCAWLSLSEDGGTADAVMRKMVSYFGSYLEEEALGTVGLSVADFDAIKALNEAGRYEEASAAVTPQMLRLGISGTPRQVIERVEELAAAGITQVCLGGPLGPDPRRAIELLGEKVLSHFARKTG